MLYRPKTLSTFFYWWTTRNCNSKLYWHNGENRILHSLSNHASAVSRKLRPLHLSLPSLIQTLFSSLKASIASCGQPSVNGYIPNGSWWSPFQGADYQLNSPQSVWYCLLHTHIVLRALLRKRAEFGPGNPKGNWQVDKCSNFFCNTNTDLGVAKATFDS